MHQHRQRRLFTKGCRDPGGAFRRACGPSRIFLRAIRPADEIACIGILLAGFLIGGDLELGRFLLPSPHEWLNENLESAPVKATLSEARKPTMRANCRRKSRFRARPIAYHREIW